MNILTHNFRHAYRNLKKNSIYTSFTISGLTIGIIVFLLTAIYIYHERTINHCYSNYNRIYRLYDAEKSTCELDFNLAKDIRNFFPEVEANAPIDRFIWEMTIKNDSNIIKVETGISTTNNYFSVFHQKIINKMGEKPFSQKMAIILTQSTASKLFGKDNAVGKTINLDNMLDLTVTAVVEDFPQNSSIQSDFFVNAENEDLRFSSVCNKGDCYNPTPQFLVLKPETNPENFIEKFNTVIKEHQSRVKTFAMQSLDDIYLSNEIEGSESITGNPSYLKVISIIAIVILLLSVINYINFSLSLQHAKIKEISIKKINGAGTVQMIFYFMSESLIILFSVTIVAFLLVYSLADFASDLFGTDINPSMIFKPAILLSLILVNSFILITTTIVPFRTTLNLNVVKGIKNKHYENSKTPVKSILITIQFAASIILLIGVITILKQLKYMETTDLGFNKHNLVKIFIPYHFTQNEALQQQLNALSCVKSSSFSNGCLGSINLSMGSGTDKEFMVNCLSVDSSFINTMGLSVIKGRQFLSGDNNKACIINEVAYKKYEWNDLENKYYKNNPAKDGYKVVGVVKDFNYASMHSLIEPAALIIKKEDVIIDAISLRLTEGNIKKQMAQIEKVWKEIAPNEYFSFQFYDVLFDNMYKKEQQLANSISVLAVITILLTIMGMLGQIIYLCINKTKEIGIRKVNGAKIAEVLFLLNQDFIKWVGIAFVIATPIAWFIMHKWLQDFAYKTSLSWWIFVGAGITALGIALFTVSWQSWRAATKNPVEALRYE